MKKLLLFSLLVCMSMMFTSSKMRSFDEPIFGVIVSFPNPYNCHQYILFYNGELTLHDCPDDLRYDPQLQVCDHPENVKCDPDSQSPGTAPIPRPLVCYKTVSMVGNKEISSQIYCNNGTCIGVSARDFSVSSTCY